MKRIFISICIACFVSVAAFGELSIQEKVETRSMPSIFGAWGAILVNRPELTHAEMLAYHDLFWSPGFGLLWEITDGRVHLVGDLVEAERQREELLQINPNMIAILDVSMRSASPKSRQRKGLYKDDFPWVRSSDGSQVLGSPPEQYVDILIDFTHPKAQDVIIGQVIAAYESGLWDGIHFDFWNEKGVILNGYRTYEAEQQARIDILKGIRAGVSDDFLIIVNGLSVTKNTAPYINGTFMETFRGQRKSKNYNHEGLKELGNELLWAEENFREPRINCLEAEGIGSELPTSPNNLRDMRLLTTLSLTHSDGYVSYTMGVQWDETHPHDDAFLNYQGPAFHRNPQYWIRHREQHDTLYHIHHHEHYWNDFWSADLGQPVGEKAQPYKTPKGVSIEGLFIREFTNGWAVHNRSGTEQTIILPNQATGVTSGLRKRQHTLPDLDGEIYLKTVVQVKLGKHPPLYWIDAKTGNLHRLADNKVENLVPGIQNATRLAVDTSSGKCYWTKKTSNRTGKIQSANLDDTNLQLVRNLTSAPLDIALNTVDGKLYLTNAWGKIQRMNLDGSDFQPNLVTDLKTPQNLVLDIATGQLYWTEQTSKTTGKIQRANFDGSNVQLVKKLTSAPRGMALDAVNRKLYLINAWGKLQRMNFDGSNFQPNFITDLKAPGQVGVDTVGGKVYWTERGKLRRADLNGGNIQDVVIGLGELTDIVLGIDSAGQRGVAAAPATQTVVEQTSLLANYPNPFNPETWIPYQLANPSDVQITIYNTHGTMVRQLDLGYQREGYYTSRTRAAYWDGRNDVGERVASGIYFYQLQVDGLSLLRKMVILK